MLVVSSSWERRTGTPPREIMKTRWRKWRRAAMHSWELLFGARPSRKKILQASKNLRIVAKFTIGVDDVDVDAATEMGILVTHGPTESNWGGVAEGTITNMLTLLKKTRERDRYLKTTTGWRDMKLQGTVVGHGEEDGYAGITLGIIGLGRIGSRIARLLRPWGM